MVFLETIDQNVSKYRTGILIKKWWWYLFAEMVDIVLQNAWMLYHIRKDEGVESIFLKYWKEGRPSSSYVGTQNVPSDVCCEVAHYQVPSKKQGMRKVYKNNFQCRCKM